jgi:hypothetical protein
MENSISRNNLVALFSSFCPQDHRSMQTFQTITRCHKRKSLECISCNYSCQFPADTSTTWMAQTIPLEPVKKKVLIWWQSSGVQKDFWVSSSIQDK